MTIHRNQRGNKCYTALKMLDHFQKLEGGCYTVLMTYKDVDETFFSIEGHKTIDTVNDDPINKTWIIFCRFLSVISYMYSEHC